MAATPVDIELTRRYQARLRNVRVAVAAAAAQAWDRVENRDTDEQLQAELGPVVAEGQDRAAALAAAYVAAVADISVPGVDARAGPALGDPLISFASAIRRGLPFDTAVALARSRASMVGASSVQWTARAAAGEAARQVDGVAGWRRVLQGRSCEWCATVATQRYRTAESASFGHARCDCTVVPILGDRDPGQVINRPVLDRLKATPGEDRTGYVSPEGTPAPRPDAIPQEPAAVEA